MSLSLVTTIPDQSLGKTGNALIAEKVYFHSNRQEILEPGRKQPTKFHSTFYHYPCILQSKMEIMLLMYLLSPNPFDTTNFDWHNNLAHN